MGCTKADVGANDISNLDLRIPLTILRVQGWLQGWQGLGWRSWHPIIVVVLHGFLDGDVELHTPHWWRFGILGWIRKLRRFDIVSLSIVRCSILRAQTVSTVDRKNWEPKRHTVTSGVWVPLNALGNMTGTPGGRLIVSLNWTVRPRSACLVLSLEHIQSIFTSWSKGPLTLQEESSRTLR